MAIIKFEVLNPVKDTKKPFYDKVKKILFVPITKSYRYFVEVSRFNPNSGGKDYYILLGETKFDINCRLCTTDNYGRCQIKVRGELRDYVVNETDERGNITVEYQETDGNYDIYLVE